MKEHIDRLGNILNLLQSRENGGPKLEKGYMSRITNVVM